MALFGGEWKGGSEEGPGIGLMFCRLAYKTVIYDARLGLAGTSTGALPARLTQSLSRCVAAPDQIKLVAARCL